MKYEPTPTTEELAAISRHLGRRLSFERRIHGGQSATSDVLLAPDGFRCVLRRHGRWSVGFDDDIADRERAVLAAAREAGIAVPAVLWAGHLTHATAIVTEFIDGAPVLQPTDHYLWAEQLAATLSGVHSIEVSPALGDLLRAAPPSPVDLEPSPRFNVHPFGGELLARRRNLSPTQRDWTTLAHGDYWPGNLLWHDGAVAAVLDWEAATLDDPMSDVGYCLTEFHLLGYPDAAEHFVAAYAESSGQDTTSLDYWIATALCRALPDLDSYIDGWRGLGLVAEPEKVQNRLDRAIERILG